MIMSIQRRKGFTLVELLVVIAIIAILMAAFFPAIQGVFDRARATAMKTQGRGVWLAITSTNYEREPLGEPYVWPSSAYSTSTDYFKFLMSDGSGPSGVTDNREDSVCQDLKSEMLAGGGVKPARTATGFGGVNNAWGVSTTDQNTPSDMPFLWSSSLKWDGDKVSSNSVVKLVGTTTAGVAAPFGGRMAVWVTMGGSTFDARKIYVQAGRISPVVTNNTPVELTALNP